VAGRRRRRDRRRLLIVGLSVVLLALLGGGLAATSYGGGGGGGDDAPDALSAPRAVSATPLSPTSVTLDWTGTPDADRYVVRVGDDRSLATAVETSVPARGSGTKLTLDDLAATTPGVDRYYRVDAVRAGEVRSSRTGRFSLPPGDVQELDVRRRTGNGFKLDWADVPNARQYDVAVARDEGFTQDARAVRTVGVESDFVGKGLEPDTEYWVKVRPVNADQVGVYSAPVAFRTKVRETSFKVATWNVCSEKCRGYEGRARIMADFLNDNEVDIFGLQEAGGVRVGAVTNRIFGGGARGFERAVGGAKARYIFFRPALFEQLDGGSFDIGDGRDTTWAKFRTKATKREFYYVDVHLDNGKGKDADARRAREMGRMLSTMGAINTAGTPMIYAGDFNSGPHRDQDTPGVRMRGEGLTNTELLTDDVQNAGINTGHTFSTEVLDSGAHIDHIWVTPDFEVDSWKQLVRVTDGRYTTPVVSDHNAVSAVVALEARTSSLGPKTSTTPLGEGDVPLG
jgi:endonuclease/exonuclease/phosphatase family metal-dependent hydrolase